MRGKEGKSREKKGKEGKRGELDFATVSHLRQASGKTERETELKKIWI